VTKEVKMWSTYLCFPPAERTKTGLWHSGEDDSQTSDTHISGNFDVNDKNGHERFLRVWRGVAVFGK